MENGPNLLIYDHTTLNIINHALIGWVYTMFYMNQYHHHLPGVTNVLLIMFTWTKHHKLDHDINTFFIREKLTMIIVHKIFEEISNTDQKSINIHVYDVYSSLNKSQY